MLPSQFNTETELSAVNSILGSIGQAPITKLEFDNPEVSYVYQLLQECNTDVQTEGWVFNTENHYELIPDSNGYIQIPDNVLQMDISEGQIYRDTDVVKRNGRLYDKQNHTDIFENPVEVDIVWKFKFSDLPQVFKRYITYRASVRAATQLVGNKELMQMLAMQEAFSRAGCMEYECNQGDYTIFGTPSETAYRSYQPYMALNRL
jgi:hypothetical protein